MSSPPSTSPRPSPDAPSADDVRRAADALGAGDARADALFDRLLPPALRAVSDDYWTPAPVVRQVAAWLRDDGVDTIVDIGSGAGKFCVGLALLTGCRVTGLEQRPSLVSAARRLATQCGVHDRVTFIDGGSGAPCAATLADTLWRYAVLLGGVQQDGERAAVHATAPEALR